MKRGTYKNLSIMTAPSREDLQELSGWLSKNKSELPLRVGETMANVLNVLAGLAQSQAKSRETLKRLREAMGIVPKSERGKSDSAFIEPNAQGSLDLESLTPEERELYDGILKKRRQALGQASKYAEELRRLTKTKIPEQMEFALADAYEVVFSQPASDREDLAQKE